jgi:hypothetical protein
MKGQKVKILLIGLMCFSYISGFSAVICHGSDGHVALELIGSMCCDNLAAGDDSLSIYPNKAFSSSKNGCGPCVDAPITAEAIEFLKKTNPVKSTVAVFPSILNSTVKGYDFFEYQLAAKLFASVNPCLASLCTIILLT